jgi:hypothetical protein
MLDKLREILIPKLAKAALKVRAMRFSKSRDELLALGASDVVIGDASNPNDIEKAIGRLDHLSCRAHRPPA